MPSELTEGEYVVKKVAANLFRGREAVGGHLWITSKRLILRPHAFNFQTQVGEIALGEIAEVRKTRTGGIVPNGMLVLTKSGVEYRFVVWFRERLMRAIEEQMSKSSNGVCKGWRRR